MPQQHGGDVEPKHGHGVVMFFRFVYGCFLDVRGVCVDLCGDECGAVLAGYGGEVVLCLGDVGCFGDEFGFALAALGFETCEQAVDLVEFVCGPCWAGVECLEVGLAFGVSVALVVDASVDVGFECAALGLFGLLCGRYGELCGLDSRLVGGVIDGDAVGTCYEREGGFFAGFAVGAKIEKANGCCEYEAKDADGVVDAFDALVLVGAQVAPGGEQAGDGAGAEMYGDAVEGLYEEGDCDGDG